jgi:hypothetical protein
MTEPRAIYDPYGNHENSEVRQQVLTALAALKDLDPGGWPEQLVQMASLVAELDHASLGLLADAAVQAASLAHQMESERQEEEDQNSPERN